MLWQQGINWHDYPARFTRGGYFQRRVIAQTFTVEELAQLPPLLQVANRSAPVSRSPRRGKPPDRR
jgi:hypothetical protein